MLKFIANKVRIKQKLIMINLLTTGIALLLAGSALLLQVFYSFRDSMLNNLTIQAEILAKDNTAPLVFGDHKTAGEGLRILKASPNIMNAIVYGNDGKVFAEYWRDDTKRETPPVPPQIDGHLFTIKHLDLFHSIIIDRDTIGRIYLRSDMDELHSLMLKHGVISVTTIFMVFAIAYLLLTRLQRVITVPILKLAETMQVVSNEKDYTQKVNINSEDEIGFLANGFNEMLEQIRERDTQLRTEIKERKRAAEDLKSANSRGERLLRFSEALLSAVPTPVFYKDSEGRYLGCNHAFSELTGFTSDQIEGKTVMDLWPSERAEVYHKKDLELMANPARQRYEFEIRDKDGRDRTAMFIKDVFYDENRDIVGIVGAFLDISERKEAEERLMQAKEEWERTFDAIVDPVMIADVHHRIIKVNKSMADKMGISPSDAEGLACYNAIHGAAGPPLFCPHSELLADGQPHSVEIYEELLGGYFIVSVSPLFTTQGEVYGSVHYARDITERKQAEESVQRMNEELEKKVQERSQQLLEAQEDLVRKEKLAILGQLSGSVGHELRNPLGVMSNAVYYLKMVNADADETTREYLDIINHEINLSQRIITDLLDFARTKAPHKKSVMVRELIEESLKRCSLPENVDIQRDIPETLPPLKVDPLQIVQVYQNIITNGIQAMPDGGAMRIAARFVQGSRFGVQGSEKDTEPGTLNVEPDGDFIEISIVDSGEGISPVNMKKLFQPLYTTKAKGIGLGLTVCRNLTEANGGRIEVESEMGKGTTFTMILPIGG